MIMAGEQSIKEVIPFPKNSVGVSPMENSPSRVDEKQLKELHIRLDLKES
jgi:aspartyl-tRNA synthetase